MSTNFIHRIAALVGFAGLSIAGTGRAQASLVNCSFIGTIDVDGTPAVFEPLISDGGSVTGTFQYDTTHPAEPGGNSGFSGYIGAITGFSFNVDDGGLISTGFHRQPGGFSNIEMYNDLGFPDYDHISILPYAPEMEVPDLFDYAFYFGILRFDDVTESVFGTAASLPPGPLDMSQFSSGAFELLFKALHSDSLVEIHGTITSLTTDSIVEPAVPEPATLALVGMGLAGVGALRRRRAAVRA